MANYKIKLNLFSDIKVFVQTCGRYKESIFIKQKQQVVNAKSLLGIYSLDLSSPIDVCIESENKNVVDDFYGFVKKWEVEE